MRSVRLPRVRSRFVSVLALLVLLAAPAAAQDDVHASAAVVAPPGKKPLTIEDYGRWRTIEDARISGSGRWVAYALRHINVLPTESKPVLYLHDVDSGSDVEIENAHSPEFSPDSRWVVYQVDSVAARGGRGGRGAAADTSGTPPDSAAADSTTRRVAAPPRIELRDLTTGETRSWQRMQVIGFNTRSTHLLLRRRAAGGGGRGGAGGGAGSGANAARGSDVVLHDLATGSSMLLGSVADIAFNRQGDLLAYAVDASMRDANGLFIMDLAGARTHVLDNDTLQYARIAWSDDGNGLAALKGREVEKKRERDNTLIAFSSLRTALGDPRRAPVVLDPDAVDAFPDGFVVSERRPLAWSEDGRRIFLGIIAQTEAPDTARRRATTDSVADVDVWRTQDERIQSVQMRRAEVDRTFTYLQAFDVAEARFIPLADSTMRDIELSVDGRWAVGRDARAYASDYERAAADLYRIDTRTGERTLFLENQLTGQYTPGLSPDGRTWLYWRDDRFHAHDLDRGVTRTLAGPDAGSFADMEWDYTGARPPYGVTGYATDGRGVLVEHRYDLWLLPLDGGAARNLTAGTGARDEVRFRFVRTEPIDSTAPRRTRTGAEIDLSRPVTLTAYGQYTKKAGFYRLADGRLNELVYDDAIFSAPVRAEHADRFLFTRQTFQDYPDLRVARGDFRNATRISDANPQQAEYVWGRNVLFDYTNADGVELQGVLTLPEDYVEGERRPMLVSFYEKNSQNLHRYRAPSFLTGMGSLPTEALSRGYITMLADVHFRTGSSHSDMLESVEAATRKVIEMGYADPERIGVHGHSYGGEGAAFIGTRSKVFAAVGMGAGVTDLYTDFSQSWGWSYQVDGGSGANGSGYYLYGQGRWGFSPWDDPDKYRFESAIAHAPSAEAPFLIMHGTADPTVSFSEGMNFYNALRYNGKNAILLAYPGEGHGLRGLANRRDLTIRYFEFFDHYLKGEEAPEWMTAGVPYLVKAASRGR
jgi:dipeptidyl aminopeptidase/acylaminoacyl peptidase